MAIRCRQKLEQETLDYKENRAVSVDVPQDRPIRRITMRFVITVNAGASNAPAARRHNHYLNAIKAIYMTQNGRDQKFFVDGVSKFYQDLFELGVFDHATAITTPAANGTATYEVVFNFDFAAVRSSLSDFSALVNAPALGSLKLTVEWGEAGDIFGTLNGASISTDSKVHISYVECFDTGDGDGPSLSQALSGATDIRETVETPTLIKKEYNSFGTNETEVEILPVPALILSHLIHTENNLTDGNPLSSNDIIKHFSFENVRGAGEPILRDSWDNFHGTLKGDYRLAANAPAGFGFINWVDQRQGGLRNGSIDAIKMKLLTEAPTANKNNGITLLTKYIPNAVPLEARV